MYAEVLAVAHKASWRDFFPGRNCSTFLNQFFHIFLSPKLVKLSVPETRLEQVLTQANRVHAHLNPDGHYDVSNRFQPEEEAKPVV
jgi:hypothetical protein